MAKLETVEGIGSKYAERLRKAGVRSTDALLAMGGTPEGRKDIAARTGIADTLVLTWINHVDLFRIKGVSEEYADLLEAAGVDTVVELARRKAANLSERLGAVNAKDKRVRRLPTATQVEQWIEQAKALPRAIRY